MSHDEQCTKSLGFPATIANRPALPRIRYRLGSYGDVREALLRWRDSTPELAGWTYRGSDDPAVALLEGSAIVTDILTFYQELYANECFLRTATWRDSVGELVRLTGYRLAPAIGGRAVLAAHVDGDDPLTIPAGFPIAAQLEGAAAAATFETVAETTAEPWLNEVALYAHGAAPRIARTSTTIVADGTVALRRGDRLFVGSGDDLRGTIVGVDAIEHAIGKTIITLAGPIGISSRELVGYVIRRSAMHFGHNAPPSGTTGQYTRNSGADHAASELAATELALDARYADITAGSTLLCSFTNGRTFVRTANTVDDRALTWSTLTAAVTVVAIDEMDPGDSFDYDIRRIVVHHVAPAALILTAPPSTATTRRPKCYGTGAQVASLAGRSLLYVDDGEPTEVAIAPVDTSGDEVRLREVQLLGDFTVRSSRWSEPAAKLRGNVLVATEGATQQELVLGNGDARRAWQAFRLPKAPLTYLRDAVHGRAPELVLFVDGLEWRRVESFVASGPSDAVYVVREDDRGDSFVQAGDGTTGRRFPSGVDNVVARYRTGAGSFGPLRENASARAARKLPRLDKLELPGVVTGGEATESIASARRAAPSRLQSLGRLVSLADYEAETLALPGVEEAVARFDETDGVSSIIVTVLMKRGRDAELAAVRDALRAIERCRGPRRYPIVVRAGEAVYVAVHVAIAIEHDVREDHVKTAVTEALGAGDVAGGLFGADTRRFGQPEYASRVLGVVQRVPGVRWTTLDVFGLAGATRAESSIGCGPDHVLRLDADAFEIRILDGGRAECAP
jgi:hypothetical protein